jgi:hypothetical protein
LTAEQLEASRAERLRQNGHGALTLEDARTWIEETGLCLFLPKRHATPTVAPSFVEAVAGQRDQTPDPKHIAIAEELLVRLELEGVAVRLNLLGQVGEQPDYVVAAWVLPYVYALRGDRDWRRSPQLTGSRQVSQLAVQAYKLLEAADTTVADLKQALGREVTEAAVLRAITELWQQLRIIPVIAAPGQAAKWQLLRHRFQKAIAEGASTSQVTAISVLASIFLQAVIAASMEEVELFLAPLTARSKVREVLRGLVATRQVHTISFGHAPHFYVAGTLPEFPVTTSVYTSSSMPASAYFLRNHDDDLPEVEPVRPSAVTNGQNGHNGPVDLSRDSAIEAAPTAKAPHKAPQEIHTPRKPASVAKPAAARPHFSRPAAQSRDRKPAQSAGSSRPARHSASDSRPSSSRSASARPASGSRPASGTRSAVNHSSGARSNGSTRPASGARWAAKPGKPTSGQRSATASNGAHSNGTRTNGSSSRPAANAKSARPATARPAARPGNGAASTWGKHNGHANGAKPAAKSGAVARTISAPRKDARPAPRSTTRPTARPGSRPTSRSSAQPARSGGSSSRTAAVATAKPKAAAGKRFGFAARPKQGTKKRG